jgi:hypothetical protein
MSSTTPTTTAAQITETTEPEAEQAPVIRSASTQPSRTHKHRLTVPHRGVHRPRPRTRP